MSWIEPKTNWQSTDRVTADDMNRITGNLNSLYPDGKLKEDYTGNDFVRKAEWEQILSSLSTLNTVTQLLEEVPGDEMTAVTFNRVEALTQNLKDRLELLLRQSKASSYAGEIYADENYARGFM